MNSKLNLKLFTVFFATLLTGTFLVFKSASPLMWFGSFYLIALYFLNRTSLDSNFFISSETNRYEEVAPQVMVLGEVLATFDKADQQEERYLGHFEINKVVKRQFFAYIFLGLAVVILFMKGNVILNLDSAIPIICGFLIIKSVYVGHLLVPLMLNIGATVLNYDNEVSFFFYVVYAFLIFLSMRLMSQASGDHLKLGKTSFLIPMAMVFLGFVYGFSSIIPEKSPLDNNDPLSTKFNPAKKALNLAKTRSQSLLSHMESLPPSKGSEDLKNRITEQLSDISRLENDFSDPKNLQSNPEVTKKLLESVINKGNELAKDASELQNNLLQRKEGSTPLKAFQAQHGENHDQRMSDLLKEMEKNQENLTKMLHEEHAKSESSPDSESDSASGAGASSGAAREAIGELEKNAENLKKEYEKLASMSSEEKKEIDKFIAEKRNDLEMLNKISSDKKAIENQAKNLNELEQLANQPQPTTSNLKQMVEAIKKSNQIEDLKQQIQTTPLLNQEQKLNPEALKAFDNKEFPWKKLIPLLVLAVLGLVIFHFMKKKGVKEIKLIDPADLEEMIAEWKKLKKLKLSPREEVIYYYNLFHDVLQKVHYPTHETPPSCIVYEDMQDFNPKLDKATFDVTEVYTKCFYGNKEVTMPTLKIYRKGIHTIMNVYGIS